MLLIALIEKIILILDGRILILILNNLHLNIFLRIIWINSFLSLLSCMNALKRNFKRMIRKGKFKWNLMKILPNIYIGLRIVLKNLSKVLLMYIKLLARINFLLLLNKTLNLWNLLLLFLLNKLKLLNWGVVMKLNLLNLLLL